MTNAEESSKSGLEERVSKLEETVRTQSAEILTLRGIIEGMRGKFKEVTKNPSQIPELASLTPEQEEIFQRLEAITGNDKAAIKLAEEVLADLEGNAANKTLVDQLKFFLKSRILGVRTKDGHAAAPVWQRDKGRPQGGYMRLQYTSPDSGASVSTESYAQMPLLKLIARPDQRKIRPRDQN